MITKNIKHFLFAGLAGCGFAAALTACSDTWDEHYDGSIAGVYEGSLRESLKGNPELSNFASVVQACGYDKSLASSQVFTVFAPTNESFSKEEADARIAEYNQQKGKVSDEDNTVIKEFVQNHIALYNYSVSPSSNDSIVLMNGKFAVLTNNSIHNSQFKAVNQVYKNGVLYTLQSPIDYASNLFEYLRKDADLDSVRLFLYNSLHYRKEFLPGASVEGGIDEQGRTIYLDSVWNQRNDLFSEIGRIGSEDSTYWMTVPTNAEWSRLVEEYTPYFNYDKNVGSLLTKGDRDSLVYTNIRLAIMKGTAFSRTVNERLLSGQATAANPLDSVFSENAVLNYNRRANTWGANFNYYQYFGPNMPYGVFNESEQVECSNGRLLKSNNWKIDKLDTFHRWIIIEAEKTGSIREISKMKDSKGDSVSVADAVSQRVNNDDFKSKVWNDGYIEFVPNSATEQAQVTFNITDVLSNISYDIYLVTVPALANDSNATAEQCIPSKMRCSLNYRDETGKSQSKNLGSGFVASGSTMDYLLLAEDFQFPTCTFDVKESEPITTLVIRPNVTAREYRDKTYTRTMRVDCILLVPHGTLELTENELGPVVNMYPHGKYTDRAYKYYYKLR